MIAEAIEASKALVKAVPLLGGSTSTADYKSALELIDYLIEHDDENPLIEFLSAKIESYERQHTDFVTFNQAVGNLPRGVEALRQLMKDYGLKQNDLREEIGGKSLVSQILSGKRSLTVEHIRALAVRFNVPTSLFID
ncbi:helix-turn-helix domain-containing protein [Rahnella bonaserana]|jgi:HTH-type transcriptional regulator/antitoxin HigA|uniref:Helix-turn-helix domain-containing protein n=1 Tax=Rahnella bonaserana TaxID=2816248 RepID=A0ABS6M1N5_9GAMM|nr:helix-turn-helix domain-containing protein [Rahnella bonaserana]MBU9857905.1 helix-turn-helix domain-containing protein [Rahnella bonaserana]MCL9642221.1 helix-turn-helix domain-containing protein [Rahnella victoriana]WHZ41952.1 helix-turn-helix domain-containing protein [Rahnella bonaserana]